MTITERTVIGDVRAVYGEANIDSYTAAGEVISTAGFDFSAGVLWMMTETSSNGFATRWDGTKIRAYGDGGGVAKAALDEPDAAADIGVVKFVAIGV